MKRGTVSPLCQPFVDFVESLGVEAESLPVNYVDPEARTPGRRVVGVGFPNGDDMLTFVGRFQIAIRDRPDLYHLAPIVGSGFATMASDRFFVYWPALTSYAPMVH